jgi:3-phosphoglycerate kinase
LFTKKTIKDIDLTGKTVLLRADYNVPLNDKGGVEDDFRLKQSLPTLKYLLKHADKVIVCSHLGRPDGKPNTKLSLLPVAKRLSNLLGEPVMFIPESIGPQVTQTAKDLAHGKLLLLENLRFHPEEEANNMDFAEQLGSIANVFVQDGFGVVHRAHASTEAITHVLPSVAGPLLQKEVDIITDVMKKPERPLMAVIGGAKIADKIEILNTFIETADFIAIGGAMANTFLMAEGISVADSLVDKNEITIAKDILRKAKEQAQKRRFIFYLPQDGVVAHKLDKNAPTRIVDWSAHVIADIENYPKRPPAQSGHILAHEMILDIGPFSGAFIAGGMQLASTVVWNGAMGVTETHGVRGAVGPYAHGTELIMEAMTGQFGHRPFSLVGGGDTVGYVEQRGMVDAFDHVSTGGGASLELMAGHKLPGVEALENK